MTFIVGLGNPGKKYERTRHNIGFLVLDELKQENNFSNWSKSKTINCLYSKKIIAGQEVELIKPLVYMNNSGKAIKAVMKKHCLSPQEIFIIHDDIDLPLGKIKISKNRGAAGHKGVASIIKDLKTNVFARFRVGIQPATGKPGSTETFVLQKFNKEEKKTIKEVIKKTAEAIKFSLKEGPEKAMNKFNK